MNQYQIIESIFEYQTGNYLNSSKLNDRYFWDHLYIDRPFVNSKIEDFLYSNQDILFLEGGVGSGKTTLLQFLFQVKEVSPNIFIDCKYMNLRELDKPSKIRKIFLEELRITSLRILLNYYSTSSNIEISKMSSFKRDTPELKNNFKESISILLADLAIELPLDDVTQHILFIKQINNENSREELIKAINASKQGHELISKVEWYHLLNLLRIKLVIEKPITLIIDNIDVVNELERNEILNLLVDIPNEFGHRYENRFTNKTSQIPIKLIVASRSQYFQKKQFRNYEIRLGSSKNSIKRILTPTIDYDKEFVGKVLRRRMDLIVREFEDARKEFPNELYEIWMYILDGKQIFGQINLHTIFNGSIRIGLGVLVDLSINYLREPYLYKPNRKLDDLLINLYWGNFYENENGLVECHLYLDSDNINNYLDTYDSFVYFMQSLNIQFLSDELEIRGSFIKRFFGQIESFLTNGGLRKRMEDAEHALKLVGIDKHQSEIDKNQAEAASSLLQAASKCDNFVAQIGSVIVLKWTDEYGKQNSITKTLTRNQMIDINKNPKLLDNPMLLLKKLKGEVDQDESGYIE